MSVGGADALFGVDAPRSLAERIRGARFQVTVGAGHDLTIERPDETARAVVAFFEER